MKQAWIFLLTVVFLFSICPCSLGQEVTPKVKEEYTEERGLALAELFWLVVDLVEDDLTPEEKDIYASGTSTACSGSILRMASRKRPPMTGSALKRI